jgi:hypothetical protein
VSCGAGDREVDLLVAAVAAAPDAPQRGNGKICELLSSRCFSCAFGCDVDLLEGLLLQLTFCLFVVAVEVYSPRLGQGASPIGGDLQPEQGSHGEAARCTQGAAQRMPHRQARSKRQPHQETEGGGVWRLLR